MYFYQLVISRGCIKTLNRQTSTYFAGICSKRKPLYILKFAQKLHKILPKNHTKIFPKLLPFLPHAAITKITQKHPKILHLYNQTTPHIPIHLFHFYFNHITPNYINLS